MIEVMVSISLIGVLLSMETMIFSKYNLRFKKNTEYDKECFYAQEASIFIENQIKDSDNLSFSVSHNILRLIKSDGSYNEIYYIREYNDSGKIVISYYYFYGVCKTSNNIVKDIKDFKIEELDNSVYLSIVSRNGKRLERCFTVEGNK